MLSNGHAGNGKGSFTPLRNDPEPPRLVPAADQLEQQLLAALLFDNSRLADVGALGPEHFGRDVHGRILELMRSLVSHGIPAKPQTLRHMIASEPTLPGLPDYLDDLEKAVVVASPAAVTYFADEVVAAAWVRQYVATANDLCESAVQKAPREGWKRLADAIRGEMGVLEGTLAYEHVRRVDAGTLADDPVVERRWLVPGWFPMLETIGFGGTGGEGKTLLAHQLATSAALGRSWLGLPVEPMKAALLLCEDRLDDAHWRQADINRDLGCRAADLKGRLALYPRRYAASNKLGRFGDDDGLQLTPFFHELLADLRAFGARLVILDTLADIFAGQQNSAEHARVFVRQVCDRIARELDGVVILLYQPSKAGMQDKTGMSGSVQWDAAFRARTMLGRPAAGDDDDKPDPDVRTVELMKSNYAAKGAELEVRWQNGVFVRDAPADKPAYELAAERSKLERVFLVCLRAFTEQGRPVSASPNAANFAPKMFAASPTSEGCKQKELDRIMSLLFHQHVIKVDDAGRYPKIVQVAL